MSKKTWVATIALVLITALMGIGNKAQARESRAKRLKLMPPDCVATGRNINALIKALQELDRRLDALEQKQPQLAIKLRGWIAARRACLRRQAAIAKQVRQLRGEIRSLQTQIRKYKADKQMDQEGKVVLIDALKQKIKAKRKTIRELYAEFKRKCSMLLKMRPGASNYPTAYADAISLLSKQIVGINKALDALNAQLKKGISAPELVKAINNLITMVKVNQDYLAGLAVAVSKLTKRLDKGIYVHNRSGPKKSWESWHYRFTLSAGPIFLNGMDFVSVATLVNIEAEHVWPNHLGILFGISLGGLVTEAWDSGERKTFFPFFALARLGVVGRWKYLGLGAEVETGWLQSPEKGGPGYLTVRGHAVLEVYPVKWLLLGVKLGVSLYHLRPDGATGFTTTVVAGFRY